jgi:hypothetical protein
VSGWVLRSALPDGTPVWLTKALVWQELSDQAEVHDLYANAAGVVAGLHHAGVDGQARIVSAAEEPGAASPGDRARDELAREAGRAEIRDAVRAALDEMHDQAGVLRARCGDRHETESRDLLAGEAEGIRRAVDKVGRALHPVRER